MKDLLEDDLLYKLKEMLVENNYTSVLYNEGSFYTSNERGIKPILDFYEKTLLNGGSICDKVIGKASSIFLKQGNVKQVYALVLSESAKDILEGAGIVVHYDKLVPHIINRDKTDLCPMEKAVLNISDEKMAMENVYKTVAELKAKR